MALQSHRIIVPIGDRTVANSRSKRHLPRGTTGRKVPDLVSAVLHDFIVANREEIIDRARQRVRERTASKSSEAKLEHGIPLFLSQLADALRPVPSAGALHLVTTDDQHPYKQIGSSAALHGHELLKNGFTVAQVVHGYGDVCQIVTALATEKNAAIATSVGR